MKSRSSSVKYSPKRNTPIDSHFAIRNTTKGRSPRLPFRHMKEVILKKNYDLSLVFVGETRGRTLNRIYRHRDTVPDVLSFPLERKRGEIVISSKKAARESKYFNMSPRNFMGYLFIHGLLHLKGYRHGRTMKREEERLLKQFHLV